MHKDLFQDKWAQRRLGMDFSKELQTDVVSDQCLETVVPMPMLGPSCFSDTCLKMLAGSL